MTPDYFWRLEAARCSSTKLVALQDEMELDIDLEFEEREHLHLATSEALVIARQLEALPYGAALDRDALQGSILRLLDEVVLSKCAADDLRAIIEVSVTDALERVLDGISATVTTERDTVAERTEQWIQTCARALGRLEDALDRADNWPRVDPRRITASARDVVADSIESSKTDGERLAQMDELLTYTALALSSACRRFGRRSEPVNDESSWLLSEAESSLGLWMAFIRIRDDVAASVAYAETLHEDVQDLVAAGFVRPVNSDAVTDLLESLRLTALRASLAVELHAEELKRPGLPGA